MQTTTSKQFIYTGLLGIIVSALLGLFVIRPGNFLQAIDLSIYQTLFPPAGVILLTLMLFVTAFGSAPLVALFSLIAVGALFIRHRWLEIVVWISALGMTELLTFIFKHFFERARPLVQLVEASGGSYPSGHAASATALAVLTLLILTPLCTKRRTRIIFNLFCLALIVAVATSRLVLGAHWLSDTIGSILLASGVVLFCYGVSYFFKGEK